jgi:hypothetical protein
MKQQKRDLATLTGALFVVLVVVAFIPLAGSTPESGASAQKVVSFYSDNATREMLAAIVLALGAVSLLFFSAILKQRFESVLPDRSMLPTAALAGGIVASGGFLASAGFHFALADSADDIQAPAAQALNALDFIFIPFTVGLAVLLLASSLLVVRARLLLPTWLGWVGIVLFVVFFTPLGFISFALSGIWIIVVSIRLYLSSDTAPSPSPAAGPATPG